MTGPRLALVTARDLPDTYHGPIAIGCYPPGEVIHLTQLPITGRTLLYTSAGFVDIPDGAQVGIDAAWVRP